ncbi:MAG: type III pantothenate kinase [Aquisalimonadaceae bacterium]
MKLLVDIGNTRVKWSWWDNYRMDRPGVSAHGGALPADFRRALAQGPAPDAVLVSSVAGPVLNDAMRDAVRHQSAVECRFLVSPASACGVRNAYAEPATLGPDRWAGLVGAWTQGLAPVCIVGCGTAVTVDVLDADGCHRGGVIFAGLQLSRDALDRGTHRLRRVADGELPILAADTASAIRTGTLQALTGAVDYLIRQVTDELASSPVVLLTGGDAELIAERLGQHSPVVQSDLVLRGLAAMAGEI